MRGKNIFRTITFRTMLQNRTRTIVTIIGVILSTAMITAVTTFAGSFLGFLVDYEKKIDGNWHVAVWELPQEEAEALRKDEKVEEAAEIWNLGFARWENCMSGGNPWGYLRIKSLPKEQTEMFPIQLYSGRMPENETEILLPRFLPINEPEDNQTKIGDTMELEIGGLYTKDGNAVTYKTDVSAMQPGEEELRDVQKKTFTVTGFYESGYYHGTYGNTNGLAFEAFCGPVKTQAQTQSDLYVRLKKPKDSFAFADDAAMENYPVQVNYGLLRWMGAFSNDNATAVMIGLFGLITGIIIVGAISLIYNAFSISVRERTTQFGLLSSIGATPKQLRHTLMYEAVFVSIAGIPIGVCCGIIGIGITLHYISFGITAMVHGVQEQIALRIQMPVLLLTVLLAVVTIVISAWVPSGRIRRISPMEAIRASKDIRVTRRQVKTGKGVLQLFGVPGMLAQKNYKRDRKKYRTTVFSLTMSIVLFVSAVTISDSLTNTGSLVLEAPEMEVKLTVYEDVLDAAEQKEALEEIPSLLAAHPEVKQSYRYRELDQFLTVEPEMLAEHVRGNILDVEGKTVLDVQCIFVPEQEFAKLLRDAGVKEEKWWTDGAAKALLYDYRKYYNPQTQRYERLQLFADELSEKCQVGNLATESKKEGDEWIDQMVYTENFSIVPVARLDHLPEGIVDNYETQPFLILPLSTLDSLKKETARNAPYCFTAKTGDYRAVYEDLEKELQARNLTDRGGVYLTNLMDSYERDRNFLLAVNVLCFGFTTLISLIALANVFNTISTNLLLRRREFAMLRSMGFSAKDSRKMLLLESVSYSLRSVVYGSVFSVGIAFLTWNIIRLGADHTFRVPVKPLFAAALAVYLMVAGTMALTMRKIHKTTICEELKMS